MLSSQLNKIQCKKLWMTTSKKPRFIPNHDIKSKLPPEVRSSLRPSSDEPFSCAENLVWKTCDLLYDLPLEMLDIILQKSYLHWIFNLSTNHRDEEFIRSLISVDVCFNRRITRQRFKKAIWRYLNDFYGKNTETCAIIRNNRNYLLENIQPSDELIASLLSLNCITEEQSHLIQRQRSNRDKNDELLYVVEPFDETTFSNFVGCLRQTNQKTVARILENGGDVINIEVQILGAKCTTSMDTQLLHQSFEDLRNRTKPRSHKTDKIISQLREEGIEILNSQLDRLTVVVWVWCHSQASLQHIQKLYESNVLRDVLLANIQPSTSKMINIDSNQFKKSTVVCPISINFTQRIEVPGNEYVLGVTKLLNEIYVLCLDTHVICVFEDENPFSLRKNIEIKEIAYPWDIESNKNEYCLYVSDFTLKCVWKITREADEQHKIVKWLTTENVPYTLSLSADGQLLVVTQNSSILMIYGSDAELIRSIQLPKEIDFPLHAVETSIGNFIIIHFEEEQYVSRDSILNKFRDSRSSGGNSIEVEKELTEEEEEEAWMEYKEAQSERDFEVSEVTRNGQMIIRRFIPSKKTQTLIGHIYPYYLSFDSDDRVFVADKDNHRVILLDFDLKWNQILCPAKEETEGKRIQSPWRLYFDEEKKQLIVGGDAVYVYTLSRK